MISLPNDLSQAIRILKWLNNNLQMGETSLKYLEKNMHNQYNQPNWNQLELNTLRLTMYCVVNSMLIWFSSFEKEYTGGFKTGALANDKSQYISLNKSCTPYFENTSSMFPNLNKIRNTILAHGYRWKGNDHLKDIEIDTFMREVTGRKSLQPYYQLSNISSLVVEEIQKVYGEINADLIVDEDLESSINDTQI